MKTVLPPLLIIKFPIVYAVYTRSPFKTIHSNNSPPFWTPPMTEVYTFLYHHFEDSSTVQGHNSTIIVRYRHVVL